MPRTSLAVGLIVATAPFIMAGCSSEPTPPPASSVVSSTVSASTTTSTQCSVLTTKQLRAITGSTRWTAATAASDETGSKTCTWEKGEERATVTVIPAQDWYGALAAQKDDELDMDADTARAWKDLRAEHGADVSDHQVACEVFDALAVTQITITSPKGATVATLSDKTSTTVNTCRDGYAISVSVPVGTSDQALGQLLDASTSSSLHR